MPDLSQMETLVLATKLGSLAAAARQLGVSPAAISKQLSRLEAELGVQLLVRSTRRLELTDVGVSYCRQCQRILEEAAVAAALVAQVKAVPHGLLKVVSGRHFANAYVIPQVPAFLRKYPQIELHLELAERLPDLNAEAVDVLIGMSVSAAGEAIQKRIATTAYTFCASPGYLRQFGVPEKPADLKHHRYLTHSMRNPDDELTFSDGEVITVVPYLRANDTQTLLSFALDGLGIVKLHHYVVKESLDRGALQAVLPSYSHAEIPIYVAYPQRRYTPSKTRCFIDFIVEKMHITRNTGSQDFSLQSGRRLTK